MGHPQLLARRNFAFDVELRSWDFSDQNGRQSWSYTLGRQVRDFVLQFSKNFIANLKTIEGSSLHTERIA